LQRKLKNDGVGRGKNQTFNHKGHEGKPRAEKGQGEISLRRGEKPESGKKSKMESLLTSSAPIFLVRHAFASDMEN
jgi:hypothetical protein